MSVTNAFRHTFEAPNVQLAGWFARHMYKSVFQMQGKLKSVDCIVEVHDARYIPFSGRNPNFRKMLTAVKPHLLVLNKADLADETFFPTVSQYHRERGVSRVLFTDCKNDSNNGIRKIVPAVEELICSSERYNREEAAEHNIMIIGVPNVGKSSLINKLRNKYLRKGKATTVGATPGVTKSVLEKIKISEDPLIFLLDTPGISSPRLPDVECGLRLSLCAILREDLVGEELMADYLLYWLNKHNNFEYVDYLGIQEPSDNIREVLLKSAINNNKTKISRHMNGQKILIPNMQWSAMQLIKGFRTGAFGKCLLDDDKF